MLAELGLKAMIAGTIVSLISASIAGIIIANAFLISSKPFVKRIMKQ